MIFLFYFFFTHFYVQHATPTKIKCVWYDFIHAQVIQERNGGKVEVPALA